MARLIALSLDGIRAFLADGVAYVGVSWGKDSVAAAHLVRQVAADIPLMHLRPTNHNPDCDAVRDACFASWAGNSGAYTEFPVDYSGVDRRLGRTPENDQQTDREWYAAIRRAEKQLGRRRILGIRADESAGRMVRFCRWGISSKNACAPLSHWKAADVFAYLAANRLPVHPAYAMLGGGRWARDRIRVAEIGDTRGTGHGRAEWESEYYGDVVRRNEFRCVSR